MSEMKSLGGYEVVDQEARNEIELLRRPWRQIRNLTVPAYADVGSDTSGVTWRTSENGVLGVEFNTDDNGEAFEVSELVFYIAGNWVSTGHLVIRANDNKTLIYLRDHIGTNTQYGCYWLRKLGKAWCVESTVGSDSRYNYANYPVSRTGYRGQQAYPYETIATIQVHCSAAFDNAGAVIEVWGR